MKEEKYIDTVRQDKAWYIGIWYCMEFISRLSLVYLVYLT